MIREIVSLCLKFRILVIVAAAAVMALGVTQLRSASVDTFPQFSPPQVEIQTEALGLSAAEVEQLITVSLEKDLMNGIPWLAGIRSQTMPGLSTIDLTFEPGTDLLKARQVVQERLSQTRGLPNFGTPPVMIQPLSSTSRVMMIGLSSKSASLIDLSVLARWKIKPRLLGVPGVANVAIWGQRDRQLQVQVDPARLQKTGVTVSQVINSTGNALWVSPLTFVQASTPGTGGFIDTSTQRFEIQHVLPITTAKDLSSVTVDGSGGLLRLGDVATVAESNQPLIGDAILSSGPGLMLAIDRFPEANTSDVTRGIEEAFAALRPGLTGIDIDTNVYRAETFTQTALRNLGSWAFIGLVLLLLLLALALFSWRLVAITFVTILLSLVAAGYVLYLRGATFNMMALAGLAIALGVVIDDAVVQVSHIRRRLREHRASGGSSMAEVVAEAAGAVGGPLVYATLVLLLIPLPLVLLDGVVGSFSRPLVLSYVLAVLASMVVVLTVTPALAFILLRNEPITHRKNPLVQWAYSVFDRTVPRYAVRPRWAYATLALLIVVGGAVVPQLGARSLLPSPQDRNLLIHWQAEPGTSLPEMDRITAAATKDLRSLPGVRSVAGHVGRAVTSDQVVNVNSAELWVGLTDSADYQATVTAVGRELDSYPGLRNDLGTYPDDRVRAVQTGTNNALVVRVYGQDLTVLRAKAEELRQAMSTVLGVVQAKVQSQAEQPTLEVEVNLAAAQRYGLKPGDVRRAAATFVAGLPVGSLYQDQKVFDVVVVGTANTRSAPQTVRDLLLEAPTGGYVRLGDVAAVRVAPFPTVIRHEATYRSIDVTGDVSGRDLAAVLDDVKNRVRAMPMPLEYHAEVLSGAAQQQNQDQRTLALAIAVAIGALLLLQAAFRSWRLAAMVLLVLPLAVVGGVLAAVFVGGIMSLGALVGLLAVLALAARNTIVLISSYQRLEATDGAPATPELVVRATRERVGPVLLSAGATAVAVLPLVLFGSAAGGEVLYPLAAVVLGGLVTSTLLTVFVVPAMYLRFSPSVPGRLSSTSPVPVED
jgi:CzcA family heavy metal efflux pump